VIDRKLGDAFSLAMIVVSALCFFAPKLVRAQVAGAALSGTVTDSTGATVANAAIDIKNTATGIVRDVHTDTAGLYTAPNLDPGVYDVSASAPGFSKQLQKAVTLTVGAQQSLNFSLQVGEITLTIEVTSPAPAVELVSSAISAEVNSTTMRELPLNGRDWSSLALLEPGVVGIRTQIGTSGNVNRGNRGFGNQLNVSGHRPTENVYRINGIVVNDYSNGSPGSVAGAQLGVDAIQEFSVLTANYSAEYGRTSGGVINAVTREGTNTFHGSAYWFLRDEDFDAQSYFDQKKSGFHLNQFGGSAGAPIQKDQTFIFGDYEAIRWSKGLNAMRTVVPSAAVRGIGTGPGGANGPSMLCSQPSSSSCRSHTLASDPAYNVPVGFQDPTTGIDTRVVPYLPLFPLPNSGLTSNGNGDTGFFISAPVQIYSEDYATARVDHRFSDKDHVDGVWFIDRSPQVNPDPFLESNTRTFSKRIMGGIEETHIFGPTLVNTLRLGYNATAGFVGQPVNAILPIAADTNLGPVAGRPAPIIGFNRTVAKGSLGATNRFNHHANSYQLYDDAFVTRGVHALKLGFSLERFQYNLLNAQTPNGFFGFPSLVGFLTDNPIGFILGDPAHSIELRSRTTFFGAYVQDDWHIRPNLTLNLGVRYEPTTLPVEARNMFTVVTNIYGGAPTPVQHLWASNPTLKNFEPRVGFVWDPFHSGKTSIRGGFGVFDVLPGPWVSAFQEAGSFPFSRIVFTTGSDLVQGDFPKNTATKLQFSTTSYQAYAPDQNPKRNYAMNWNVTVQRQITDTLMGMVGYVGSHTVHSTYTTDNSNMVAPTTVPGLGLLWPCGPSGGNPCAVGFNPDGSSTNTIDPLVGQLRPTFWAVNARYQALEAQITKRMSHGLQVEGSYTWGKCQDDGSGGDIGDPFTNSLTSLIFFASLGHPAPCDFDISQNFVANWIWEVPGPKRGVLSRLAGGWELGGIATASTGAHVTMLMGGDPLGQMNGDSYDFPNRLAGCNAINSNYKSNGLPYVNLDCFTPPTAPASFASRCDSTVFAGAVPAPSGTVYCANLFGNSPRNSITGPSLFDLDFSVFKNNHIRRVSESFNIQLRAEMFNVLNHPNFQAPINNSTLFNQDGSVSGGAGQLDSTTTDPREIQFSMKVIW
jgi:hypothetical protein